MQSWRSSKISCPPQLFPQLPVQAVQAVQVLLLLQPLLLLFLLLLLLLLCRLLFFFLLFVVVIQIRPLPPRPTLSHPHT